MKKLNILKKLLVVNLGVGFIFSSSAMADEVTRNFSNPHSIPLPAVALVDDVTALPINPGAAGAHDFFDLYISKSIGPNTLGQINIFGGLPNLALGFQQFDGGILGDIRKYSISYALPVHDYVNIGAAYHFNQQLNQTNGNIHSFDAGVLFRPVSFLSVGATVKNLNAPTVQESVAKISTVKRSYLLGLGVRPFGDQITLTADAQWDEGDPAQAISGMFGVEAEPIDGLILRGMVDLRGQFGFDLGFFFNHVGLGYYRTFNSDTTYDGVHAQITNETFSNILQNSQSQFAYIDMTRGIQVDNSEASFNLLKQRSMLPFWDLLVQLDRVRDMNQYKGVILEIGHLQVGLGLVEEMRQALQKLQHSGKKVVVYLKEAGMAEYYLASVADQVVMHPMGNVQIAGFAYVLPHYKELLDKIGVEVEFIKVGKYKTGLESYTMPESSEPTKEQLVSVQQDDFTRYTQSLMAQRHLDEIHVDKIMNKGLFTATEAKEIGLVDRVAYKDELDEIAGDVIHEKKIQITPVDRVNLYDSSWESSDQIAVIYASGSIVEGYSGNDILFGEQFVGSRSMVDQIRKAARNERIKAIVLRINSPGGSALASDEIFRALKQAKKETGKPIVVSMGDIAASGGYWIAMASDKILANPSTITGSIGIFAGKANLKGLNEKLGVSHTVIKSSPHADANGSYRAFTPDEKQILQNHLKEYYRIFLERVSDNRKLDIKQVEDVAQGRIYTGAQAHENNLVDQIGGLEAAIEVARGMANIKTREVKVLHLPEPEALFERVNQFDKDINASVQRLFPPQGISILAITR